MKTLTLLLTLFISFESFSSTTVVGNGDNGADLEGFIELKTGPIVTARNESIKLLKKLNVKSIRGLGLLTPEVERSPLYMTRKDITNLELKKLGAFEVDMRGYIYARTFARPHAATRFFPISETLNQDQLIALHIHEGLHRSLPHFIREDEKVASEITLAITSPDASYDSIKSVVDRLIPQSDPTAENMSNYYLRGDEIKRNFIEYEGSIFGAYASSTAASDKVNSSHIISSKLYPFGGRYSGIGLGLKFSYLTFADESVIGPLSISLDGQFNTITRFKIWWFLEHSMSANSDDAWKDSSFGRDLTRVGVKMYGFSNENLTLTNSLSYTMPSTATDNTFSTPIEHEYGGIVSAKMNLKAKYKGVGLGGFVEYSIADTYRQYSGGTFDQSFEPEKIVILGPEVAWIKENYSVIIFSRFALNNDENFDLNRFSDIFNYGAGKENIGLKVNFLW